MGFFGLGVIPGLSWLQRLSLGLLVSTMVSGGPLLAAERLSVRFGELERSVSVKELAVYASTGQSEGGLSWYLDRLRPAERLDLRRALSMGAPFSSLMLSQALAAPIGQEVIAQLAKALALPAPVAQSALEAALVLGAAPTGRLSLIHVLEAFPLRDLPVDGRMVMAVVREISHAFDERNKLYPGLVALDGGAPLASPVVQPNLTSLAKAGPAAFTRQPFRYVGRYGKTVQAVLYLPAQATAKTKAPLVVLAPGLDNDFNALLYLAQHLASHGYGVATLNFPFTSSNAIGGALMGSSPIPPPGAWFGQPRSVSDLIDQVQQRWGTRIDTTLVGALGQSLGGYTVTALGGARLDWAHLQASCKTVADSKHVVLNLAMLWQCQDPEKAVTDPDQSDPRVKAVVAVNPVTNPIFSAKSLGAISTPMLFIAGTHDIFAPPISQQVGPFTSLKQPGRMVAVVDGATHLSFLDGSKPLPVFLVGPDRPEAYQELKGLSLAFFDQYVLGGQLLNQLVPAAGGIQRGGAPLTMLLRRQLSMAEVFAALEPLAPPSP